MFIDLKLYALQVFLKQLLYFVRFCYDKLNIFTYQYNMFTTLNIYCFSHDLLVIKRFVKGICVFSDFFLSTIKMTIIPLKIKFLKMAYKGPFVLYRFKIYKNDKFTLINKNLKAYFQGFFVLFHSVFFVITKQSEDILVFQ